MDIRTVSDEEKLACIEKTKGFFTQIRNVLNTLEIDIENEDLMTQASAVWISGQLVNWFNDFTHQIRDIHKQKAELQQQMMQMSTNGEQKNE